MTGGPSNPSPNRGSIWTRVIPLVVALWVATAFVQLRLDQRRSLFNPMTSDPKRGLAASVKNNVFGASLLGVREVVAGMLWVKADELFHTGKYTELVPYFSLVTFLDPHQIDVYSTGAWHLSYNFGDPRMLTQSKSFLREGIRNNPTIWDLYFQMGWLQFDWPCEDYESALPWFVEATKFPDSSGEAHPPFVDHMVAHTMVRQGRIDDAVAKWNQNLATAEKEIVKAKTKRNQTDERYWQQERDVCRNNRDLVIVRKAARGDLSRNPKNLHFDVHVNKLSSGVLHSVIKVVGMPPLVDNYGETANARVEIILQDKGYDRLLEQHAKDLTWITTNLTRYRSIYNVIEKNTYVSDKNQPFVNIELNKDPADLGRKPSEIFPLKSDDYELIFRFEPRVRRQPEIVQEAFGWIGEGLALGPQTRVGPTGVRWLELRIPLKRDQIL